MKKVFLGLFATVLLLTSQQINAQINVGAKMSAEWSNVYTNSAFSSLTSNLKGLSSINFGIVAEKEITNNFSIQPEINFQKTGFSVKESTATDVFGIPVSAGAEVYNRFSQVQVPILLKYKMGTDLFKGYVVAGPTFGYTTSGEVETKAAVLGIPINVGTFDVNLESLNYEQFEVGATAGIGGIIDLEAVQIFADFRYGLGFQKVADIPYVDDKIRNKRYGFSLGAMISI